MAKTLWKPFCVLALLLAAPLLGRSSVDVEPGHATFRDLERLDGIGCAQGYLESVKPLSFMDLRKAIFLPEGHECNAPEWLINRSRFFQPTGRLPSLEANVFLQADDNVPLLGTGSVTTPLFPLRGGRIKTEGVNLTLDAGLLGSGGGDLGFGFGLKPFFWGGLSQYEHFLGRIDLFEWYLKASYKRLELRYGKTQFEVGDAKHGTLIYSQAAPPLNHLGLSLLPMRWGFLGTSQFSTWLAFLGEVDSGIDNPFLWTLNLSFHPSNSFEFGFSESFLFGGNGAPALSVSDIPGMLFGFGDQASYAPFYSFYFNFWLPKRIAKLSSQLLIQNVGALEDLWDQHLSKLFTLYVPIGHGGLRVEYVHTAQDHYKDAVYTQGWTEGTDPLGHPIGPDGEGIYLDVEFSPIGQIHPELLVFYETRNRTPGSGESTETRIGAGVKIGYEMTKYTLVAEARYANATNHKYVAGAGNDIFAGIVKLVMKM